MSDYAMEQVRRRLSEGHARRDIVCFLVNIGVAQSEKEAKKILRAAVRIRNSQARARTFERLAPFLVGFVAVILCGTFIVCGLWLLVLMAESFPKSFHGNGLAMLLFIGVAIYRAFNRI